MYNEDNLIDKAILFANDKIPFELTENIMDKRNKLLSVMPKGNEKAINEYGEAILKESAQLYEEAMHYLISLHNLADSDVLQELFAIAG